ncbi:MAG: DNA-methyltransferase [Ignavibacteriales bacterium]
MKTSYAENKILHGSALDKLKELESESVDCIITSPPYYALRDYKVDGQIGNEKTIDEYVDKLIAVFTEAKRVLKKEGTCWIVLGDTYSGGGNDRNGINNTLACRVRSVDYKAISKPKRDSIFSPKTLCMVPERFAIKMIDNGGWILRNKIIWKKNNCMPSSAKDRFTIDYEFIYFFTKSKKYYFKTQYEPLQKSSIERIKKGFITDDTKYDNIKRDTGVGNLRNGSNPSITPDSRIKRCVWTINTKPFAEAHFAVFPEELVKQCLDAGCPENGIVLDMFMGAGTTALVALKHNRKFVGIELNPDYVDMAMKRIDPYLKQQKIIT